MSQDASLQGFRKINPETGKSMSEESSVDYDNPSYKADPELNGGAGSKEPPAYNEAVELNGAATSKELAATSKEEDKGSEEDKEKEKEKAVSLGAVFRYATSLDILLMIGGTLCACVHGACLPILMIVFGDMTDLFIDSADTATLNQTQLLAAECNWTQFGYDWEDIAPPDGDEEKLMKVLDDCGLTDELLTQLVDKMATFSIYYVIVGCVVIGAAYGQVAFWLMAAYRQSQTIRITLFRSIMRQDIGWFDTHEAGELNTRLADDVIKIQEGIGDKIGNFFQWFSTFVVGIVIGFFYGWKLCLVILSTSPLLVGCGVVFTKLSSLATEGELAAYAKAGAIANEVISSIRTVFAFGGQEKESERYNNKLGDAQKYGIKKAVANGGSMGVVFFIIYAVYALAFWYGAKLVREEPQNYTGGNVLIVFFSVLIGAFALGNAAPNLQNLAVARGAAYFIYDLIDREPTIDNRSEEGIKPDDLIGNISIHNVSFVYPARPEVKVLDDLCLEVKNGQTAALVGHSGCGKSTVVQLLQRFYDVEGGSVQIDGKNVKDYHLKWLRQHIGVVSQEPVLFDTTIKENIMFGREGVTMDEIVQATREANAYDFIEKLPKKFDTLVGERGAQLSGGQKQRIAIARALVRYPKILLLDEATSALDTESEASVQAALDKARQGRTTLVIAHRLSTVKDADVIFGFQDGKVRETGSHDQLMALGENGIYYKLVTNQQTMDPVQEEIENEIELEEKMDRQSSHDMKGAVKRHLSRSVSHHSQTDDKKKAKDDDEEDLPPMSLMRIMRLNSPEWLYMVIGCIASIINGGTQPAFAVIFAEIIGVFAKPTDEQEDEVLIWSLMFIVIGISAGISMFLQSYMFGMSGEKLTLRMRDMVFRTLLKQEIAYYDDHKNSTGALCTRLSTDAAAVQGATGARIGGLLMNFSAIGTGVIIGFVYSWKLTLLVIAFVPMIAVAGLMEMRILQGTASQGREALEEAGKIATEVVTNIRTVASLTKENYFLDDYAKQTSVPYNNAMKKSHAIGLTFSISQALIFFAYAAIFYLGAYLVENDNLLFEDMFKVFGAIIFGAMAVGQAAHFAPDYGKATAAGARIFFLMDREPLIDSSSTEGQKPASVKGVIHFKDVEFHYPTRPSIKVLQGLNLDIMPGQSIALVGPSGCGKSTAVSLAERFYDADGGSVKLDGVEIRDLNIQWLRSQMAIVQQEPILFDTSIRENIAYGALDTPQMDDIIKAAREANIHDFISTLPNGYDTSVGDKGTQMSGGQKQRIAIARALIRNPKILLLDEATSALDTESEKVVQEALEKAQRGRTSIVIAHRLSTIQNSDCIFVIRNGVVYEKGTHNDLLSKKGIYYKLNIAQQKKKSSK